MNLGNWEGAGLGGDPGRVMKDPWLRLDDDPGVVELMRHVELLPDDPYLGELLAMKVAEGEARAEASGDPFHCNYPPQATLPPLDRGRVPLASLPTGDVVSLPVQDLCCNAIWIGPTGSGKTSSLRLMMASLPPEDATVLAWDRKGDLSDSSVFLDRLEPPLVLRWDELPIAFLQPPVPVRTRSHVNTLVELLAQQGNLFASRRLMIESLDHLFQRRRSIDSYPTVRDWIAYLKKTAPKAAYSRRGQYFEAVLFWLLMIERSFGDAIDHTKSDLWETLFSYRGLVVIRTAGLPAEMESLLVSIAYNWLFEAGAEAELGSLHPVLMVVDDSLPLVVGSSARESEGGFSPLSRWAFMGRSRGIGLVVSCQNWSLISPAIRNNCQTVVCCGALGKDAEDLGRHLHLSREQEAVLSTMRPGEAVLSARTVWNKPLYGRIPDITRSGRE